jgi:ketosteroid isomerase-like protein
MTISDNETADVAAIRELLENWARAVRAKDLMASSLITLPTY